MDDTLSYNRGGGFAKKFLAFLLVAAVLGGIAFAVLNWDHPYFDEAARGELDRQATAVNKEGAITRDYPIWWDKIRGGAVECHYRSSSPATFLISGTLESYLVVPGTGYIKWWVEASAVGTTTLSGKPALKIEYGTSQKFYGKINSEGFRACKPGEVLAAQRRLGIGG